MLYACWSLGMVESPANQKTMATVAHVTNYSFKCVLATYD